MGAQLFSFDRIFPIALSLTGSLVILFLIAPIIAIVPLSFNAEPFFTYPMPGFSLQWYREFFASEVWQLLVAQQSDRRRRRNDPVDHSR